MDILGEVWHVICKELTRLVHQSWESVAWLFSVHSLPSWLLLYTAWLGHFQVTKVVRQITSCEAVKTWRAKAWGPKGYRTRPVGPRQRVESGSAVRSSVGSRGQPWWPNFVTEGRPSDCIRMRKKLIFCCFCLQIFYKKRFSQRGWKPYGSWKWQTVSASMTYRSIPCHYQSYWC